ncbi:hypothetical protein ILUMI_22013 [Ignelater luminosus]|uniref:Uncharacterized protein n=1 Tax=Ignelater luminosus TaxID=2038154 RepID=A0A8K0CBD5_IGNLU|nr:hypothetical protein ILUMI_22013 [Ignelater luminosus]
MCTNGIADFAGKTLTDEDIRHRTRDLLKLILGKTDVANTSPQEQAKIVEAWLESILDDPITQANGFKFHFNNWPSLHEYINPNVLPPEYEGNGPEIDFEKSLEMLLNQESLIGAKLMYYRISNE